MSNLVVPVPRKAVQEAIATLNRYIILANKVTGGSSLEEIKTAERCLYTGMGLCHTLKEFRMIKNADEIMEDLNRIEDKIKRWFSENKM